MDCELSAEVLAAYSVGDVDASQGHEVEEHVRSCEQCRRHLQALGELDGALRGLVHAGPLAKAVLSARRLLSKELRGTEVREVMTLKEAAELLRISLDELGEILNEFPAFEIAGQIRVRRTRVVAWIERRERAYQKSSAESEVARAMAGVGPEALPD